MGLGEPTSRTASRTYGRLQRALETAAVLVYGACTVGLAAHIAPHIAPHPHLIVAAILVGYLAADLVAGIVHWLADTYGSPHTPLVGPTIIYGFREHHDDPQKILQHDFVETNGASAAAAVPIAIVALTLPGALPTTLFVKTALASLTLAIVATNQLHKWAHMRRAPAAVRILQRLRIILRPTDHARHHAAPFRTHYCITTGWLNGPLAKLGFFAGAERTLQALTKRS